MTSLLQGLAGQSWIENQKPNNTGGIGNTIDSLLGLPENNLPISDSAQWEMKTHRIESSSLVTLFHMEPRPKARVPKQLLPLYGWPDQQGRPNEMSFRQTINTTDRRDRGFGIAVDLTAGRMTLEFDAAQADSRHSTWLASVEERVGLGQLDPQPYWEIKDLMLRASTKLLNTFFVEVESTRQGSKEWFRIQRVQTLQGFSSDKFLAALSEGNVYIDFDARTHHNHGTKIRIPEPILPQLYLYVDTVVQPPSQ